jgi:hypothetical protein
MQASNVGDQADKSAFSPATGSYGDICHGAGSGLGGLRPRRDGAQSTGHQSSHR